MDIYKDDIDLIVKALQFYIIYIDVDKITLHEMQQLIELEGRIRVAANTRA